MIRLSLLLIVFVSIFNAKAQSVFDLDNSLYCTLSDSTYFTNENGDIIRLGGVSGIEKSNVEGEYLLIVDKARPIPGYFTAEIIISDTIAFKLIKFHPFKDKSIEGESIRINPVTKQLYFTDEKYEKTGVYKLSPMGKEVILPWYSKYAAPMRFNSGYEGLCFSDDGKNMFTALERPLQLPDDVIDNFKVEPVCPIIKSCITDNYKKSTVIYGYPLQEKNLNNGVSEILFINDTTLWAIERSYIKKEDRNTVSLFSLNLNNTIYLSDLPIDFHNITELLRPKLLFSFETGVMFGEEHVKPGNIEGACFSHDGRYLILITDNNYGNKENTPTEIYALKIAY